MLEEQPDWRKYETYTVMILNDEKVRRYIENYFDLVDFEVHPKKGFKGRKTQTLWEIDGHGYDGSGKFVLIECKHYSSRNVTQNTVAAFSYIIKDIGAERGIIVTTFGLQLGAVKVAEAEQIGLIQLNYNSTDKNFFICFSNAEGNSNAVGVFTDNLNGISLSSATTEIKKYPIPDRDFLEKIILSLKRKTGKITFSDSEILEEALKLSNELET